MTGLDILCEVAIAHGVTIQQIRSTSHAPRLMRARIDAAQRLRRERGMSGGAMAKLLNRSDWSCRYYFNATMRRRHQIRKLQNYHERQKPRQRLTRIQLMNRTRPGDWCKTFTTWAWA